MENNIVITQDMIDSFTASMREAYRVYGDDEERVHGVMDYIMCETLDRLGFTEGVEIFNEAPKWYA
jgi:hypothetical protein|nr:MAG TPA: hypothetical protein [Caudoviricetes sp.]